jgi:hypothetical protein
VAEEGRQFWIAPEWQLPLNRLTNRRKACSQSDIC